MTVQHSSFITGTVHVVEEVTLHTTCNDATSSYRMCIRPNSILCYPIQGCIHRILSGPVCLCVGSPCQLYPLPTYQKDANVIMILEGSYNHLANSAGMG